MIGRAKAPDGMPLAGSMIVSSLRRRLRPLNADAAASTALTDVPMPICSRALRFALIVSVFALSYWVATGSAESERETGTALAISCSFAAAAWGAAQVWELIRTAAGQSRFSEIEENDNEWRRRMAS
jgi:hypothetical protein